MRVSFFIARHGAPGNIAELAKHSRIGFDQATAFVRNASKALSAWRREAFASPPCRVTFDALVKGLQQHVA